MSAVPRALLFDLDDTLIEEEPARDAALLATARAAAGRGADPIALAAAVRRAAHDLWWGHPLHPRAYGIGVSSWEALWARFEGDAGWLRELRAWAPEYRLETWRRALAAVGVEDRGLSADLAERFPVERRAIRRPYPDAEPVLRALRADGRFRLGILTNGLSCLQREKLRGAGLERWFDAVVAGGDIGTRKPDPAAFDALLERLGARRPEALMIGNNPETDVAGARAADIPAILVVRDGNEPRGAPDDLAGVDRVRDLTAVARRLGVEVGPVSGRGSARPPRS